MGRSRRLFLLLAISLLPLTLAKGQPALQKADNGKMRRESLLDWVGGMPLSKPALLSGGVLDATLNLSADQQAKIREILAAKTKQSMDLLTQMRDRKRNQPFDPNNPQQRAESLNDTQMMTALRERLDREIEKEVKALLEPMQWDRFDEIQFQLNGPMAFLQQETHDRLHLEKDQVKKIQDAITKARGEWMQSVRMGRPGNFGDPAAIKEIQEKRKAAATRFRENASKAISEILTKDQRAQVEKLQGKPLDKEAFIRGEPEKSK